MKCFLISGIPRGSDGLEVRLYNGYFVTFDNLSSLSRKISDILAVAVTGGSFSKRALYIEFTYLFLPCISSMTQRATTSSSSVRRLIFFWFSLAPDKVLTEEELWAEFEKDRPKMLGACFNVLAAALNDMEEVQVSLQIFYCDLFKGSYIFNMVGDAVFRLKVALRFIQPAP